jgi:hypothetical protein
MGRIPFLLILTCISAGLWFAFAKLVVPPIIQSAYRGESLSFLNSMIKSQHTHSVDYYLQKWNGIATDIVVSLLGLWLLALIASTPLMKYLNPTKLLLKNLEFPNQSGIVGLVWGIRLIFFSGMLLFFICQPGPDFSKYQMWGSALKTLDPNQISSTTLSPTGFPLSHWAHGVGFIYQLPSLLTFKVINPDMGYRIIAVGIFLLICFLVLNAGLRMYEADSILVVFVLGLIFVGTNAGYYFQYFASELLTLAIILVVTLPILSRQSSLWEEMILIGSGIGLMFTIRPQAIPMLFPVTAAFMTRRLMAYKWRETTLILLIMMLLMLLGAAQFLQFNYWMTGDYWSSHYKFGDGQFTSIDFSGRYLPLVLFSSRVGVLRFHPITLVGFFCSIAAMFISYCYKKDLFTTVYHLVLVLVSVLEIWVVSGYYAWSGGWSFGSRYLMPLIVLLVFSIGWIISDLTQRNRYGLALGLTFLCVICAAYSSVRSFSNIYDFFASWFHGGQLVEKKYILQNIFSVTGMLGVLLIFCWKSVSIFRPFTLNQLVGFITLVFGVFFLFLLSWKWIISFHYKIELILVGFLFFLLWYPINFDGNEILVKNPSFNENYPAWLAGVMIITLLLMSFRFIQFAHKAEEFRLQQLENPQPIFQYKATFHIKNFETDVRQAKSDYELPDADIDNMHRFLKAAKEKGKISIGN